MTKPGSAEHRNAGQGSLRRSIRLFRLFRLEQTQPDVFYGALAADAVAQVGEEVDLNGKVVLDVGGGPGYFRDAFTAVGARYVGLDADLGELSGLGVPAPGTVVGSGLALPVGNSAVDVAFSSNVLEHVHDPELMAEEMLRVVRPGGLLWLSYTLWLSPWGGHETSPWHYLGGERAARRYRRTHGKEPKNRYGVSLFPLTAARMLRWARGASGAELVYAGPRYHPRWARWVTSVPGLREVAAWNLLLVLRRV